MLIVYSSCSLVKTRPAFLNNPKRPETMFSFAPYHQICFVGRTWLLTRLGLAQILQVLPLLNYGLQFTVVAMALKVCAATKSVEETERLGEAIGRLLRGGEIIELSSDLGGGKTTLTKGIVQKP